MYQSELTVDEQNEVVKMLLASINDYSLVGEAWVSVLNVCKSAFPDYEWHSLPENFSNDVLDFVSWLESNQNDNNLSVLFCLDTLNMDNGNGVNVEIIGIDGPMQGADSLDYLSDDNFFKFPCEYHLISGLYHLKTIYESTPWEMVEDFADYVLPMAYSGICINEAMKIASGFREVGWGFGSGDCYYLGFFKGSRFITASRSIG